jgi:hypothetical protein
MPRKKSPMTRLGIDPGTFWLVAQYLNHYATPGPQRQLWKLDFHLKQLGMFIQSSHTTDCQHTDKVGYKGVKNTISIGMSKVVLMKHVLAYSEAIGTHTTGRCLNSRLSTHCFGVLRYVIFTKVNTLQQRFSNFFQVGTTFISQNVLRTTLLLSPLKANLSFF